MSEVDTLKEFLVKIGFEADTGEFKKFQTTMASMESQLTTLVAVSAGAATAIVAATVAAASSFEKLGYLSQRSGTSVAALKALEFAAGQFGSSAEDAAAAVENLGKKFRDSPGFAAQLRNLGVDMSGGAGERLISFMDRIAKMPTPQRNSWLQQYGFSETLFNAIENPRFRRTFEENVKLQRQFGLNADEAAKNATGFERSLRDLYKTLDTIKDSAVSGLFKEWEPQLRALNDFLKSHSDQISGAITHIGGAFDILGVALLVRVIPPLARLTALLVGIRDFAMPGWMATLLGIPGVIAGGLFLGSTNPLNQGEDELGRQRNGPPPPDTRNWWQRTMPKFLGGQDAPTSAGQGYGDVKQSDVADYIRKSAVARGIDPNVALAVAKSEGLGSYVGDKGTSFGPYQLHYKNNIPGLSLGGLGDSFTKSTGLDARDGKTWRQQVDYALDEAAKGGWTPWHGAARVGIGPRQGLDGARPIGVNMSNPQPERLAAGVPKAGTGYRAIPGLENFGVAGANAAPARNPFGSLDADHLRTMFKTQPLGVGPGNWSSHTDARTYSPTQNVTVHVDGAASPTDTANAIGGNLRRAGSDLVRNMSPVAQ